MSEQYGIEEYVGDNNLCEIPCIMKRFYSDFIVIEIPTAGSVLQPIVNEKMKRALAEDDTNEQIALKAKRLKSETAVLEDVSEDKEKGWT